jgi:hypothetical protein
MEFPADYASTTLQAWFIDWAAIPVTRLPRAAEKIGAARGIAPQGLGFTGFINAA